MTSLTSWMQWVLLMSGAATALGGLAATVFPVGLLRAAFGLERVERSTTFFVRHWGVLLFVVGLLIAYSAGAPATQLPILSAAALEKFAVVALIFFGPIRRTAAMTAIALADGAFAVLYVICLTAK
jgi:hypothetical protein